MLAPFVCGGAAYIATRLSSPDPERVRGAPARLPLEPDPLELPCRARPRHERRAEDDGRHRADADRRRYAGPARACPSGSRSLRTGGRLGTFSGGWRVIKTLGTKVTDIEAAQGFSAEAASSTTILASSYFGFSLSTTQVVSGGIMGAGLGRRGRRALDGRQAHGRRLVLTMPAAADGRHRRGGPRSSRRYRGRGVRRDRGRRRARSSSSVPPHPGHRRYVIDDAPPDPDQPRSAPVSA